MNCPYLLLHALNLATHINDENELKYPSTHDLHFCLSLFAVSYSLDFIRLDNPLE
jgi:hypothetical protein